MAKVNKKSRGYIKDMGFHPGEHGYGQLGRSSYQRYNATLGCFEDVPGPVPPGLDVHGQTGAPSKKSRIKVMVKPMTNEAGVVMPPPRPPPPLPPPEPQPQSVARYEEVVEEDGQVVVHVPDSAAGPDGVIRLLQVTNEDGTVHYISADQAELEEDYTVEDAMEMILTEGDPDTEQVVTEQHMIIRNIGEHQDIEQETAVNVEDGESDARKPEPATSCYVCGESAPPGHLTPLISGRSRHSAAPLAELLADTVQRELTVSTADGLCAVCLTLTDRCERPGPLRPWATRHLRNMVAVRLGDGATSRRGPGRSRANGDPGDDGPWADFGAGGEDEWTPVLDVRRAVSGRRSRSSRPWSPDLVQPKLEQLTDLTVPSETKRSARIAIRKNAYVAAAVHASSRPRVLVVPDLQASYVSRPPRKFHHRTDRGKAKGRRGRPKLPNPPENEPHRVVTVHAESSGRPQVLEDVLAAGDGRDSVPTPAEGTRPAGPDVSDQLDEEEPETLPRQADPDCPCIMCTELSAEERRRLEADPDFSVLYVCQVCGQEMTGRQRYVKHERLCKLRQLNPRRLPLVHECSTCNRTFKSARLRDEHYTRSGHEKRSPCPVCKRFFHPDFLRIHINSHSGAFLCKVCNTHFSSKATLRGHMYRHSGLKPHKCDVCSVAFRTPSSLFMHKRYHHSGERPYACNFCPKGFAARSTLRIHLRQHTGERPFVCKLCGKSYTRKSSLTQHLRSHTQERRHVCMTCGKRFDNKTYLTVHMNRHLGVRAHRCERCGRGFFSRPNLLKHMQVLCFKNEYGKPTPPAPVPPQLTTEAEPLDEDIQTTEVILAIETIPEGEEVLVGHLGP